MVPHPSSRRFRLVALLLLLVSILLVCVAAGAQPAAPGLGDPPDIQMVKENPEEYIGEQILVEGIVQAGDPIRIRGTSRYDDPIEVTLKGGFPDLDIGDTVVVAGYLESGRSVVVERAIHKPSSAHLVTRLLSLLAGLWILARAARDWRFDPSRLTFAPRFDGDAPEGNEATGGEDA